MKKEQFQTNDATRGTQEIENVEMLTFSEACSYLKISKSFLYKATSDRIIPFFKPTGGKLLYFSRKDLHEWLTKNRYPSKQELGSSTI